MNDSLVVNLALRNVTLGHCVLPCTISFSICILLGLCQTAKDLRCRLNEHGHGA